MHNISLHSISCVLIVLATTTSGMEHTTNTIIKQIGALPYDHPKEIFSVEWSPKEDRCLISWRDSRDLKDPDAKMHYDIYDALNFNAAITSVPTKKEAFIYNGEITFNPHDARKILYTEYTEINNDEQYHITVLNTETMSVVGRIPSRLPAISWNGNNVVVSTYNEYCSDISITEYTTDLATIVATYHRSAFDKIFKHPVSIEGQLYLISRREWDGKEYVENLTTGTIMKIADSKKSNGAEPFEGSNLCLLQFAENYAICDMTTGSSMHTLLDMQTPLHKAHDHRNNALIFGRLQSVQVYQMNEKIFTNIVLDHGLSNGLMVVEGISPNGTYLALNSTNGFNETLEFYKTRDLYLAALAKMLPTYTSAMLPSSN